MKPNPTALEIYTDKRSTHWDEVALRFRDGSRGGRAYHRRLRKIYQNLVPPGQRVLELGCGAGDLLAACRPAHGVGVDFSRNMLREAAQRYPSLEFIHSDVLKFEPNTVFDVVILSDLINDLWDVQGALETAARAMGPRSRLILNFYSRVWEPALQVAARLGLAQPMLPQNWLSRDEMRGLLGLAGLEQIRSWREILLPLPIPVLQTLANKYLVRFWPLNHLAVTNFSQVRPLPNSPHEESKRKVSVIVPVRNEAGNIPQFSRGFRIWVPAQRSCSWKGIQRTGASKFSRRRLRSIPRGIVFCCVNQGSGKGTQCDTGLLTHLVMLY